MAGLIAAEAGGTGQGRHMTAIKVVTPAEGYPVTLEEAKAHLRVDFTDDDDLIEAMLAAATEYAEKFQGRALLDQTLDVYLDAFPVGAIELPKPPVIEVLGVYYRDGNNDEQEFTGYELDLASEPARIYVLSGGSWPTPAERLNAVRIRTRNGYLDSSSPQAENVPKKTKAAIKLIIGTLYAQRETMVTGVTVTQIPWSAEHLLRQERIDLSLA